MQYSTLGKTTLSRLGLGTKRMPIKNSNRVARLDKDAAAEIADAARARGVNYFDTSYSNHKGEAETFLGDYFQNSEDMTAGNTEHHDLQDSVSDQASAHHCATSFFELVDPRYDYVFQKQLKKLKTDCIDFYYIEGVCDLTRKRDIDSGATDFFFKQKEKGFIKYLGFSSELSPTNLSKHIAEYPWDFVRMRINYFDWFMNGLNDQYALVSEKGLPIIAHASQRVGSSSQLKPAALQLLKDHNREANCARSSIDWALRFVKSLENVRCVTCNMYSIREVEENTAVFEDNSVLSGEEMELLEQVAQAQKTIHP